MPSLGMTYSSSFLRLVRGVLAARGRVLRTVPRSAVDGAMVDVCIYVFFDWLLCQIFLRIDILFTVSISVSVR